MRYELISKLLISTLIVILATGCAGRQHPQVETNNEANLVDPYENLNRSVFRFNNKLDKYVLKPLAKGYQAITPDPVESGIRKFFGNLTEPRNAINSLLQGKFDKAGLSTGRFVLNSTVGLLGFFDVAGKLDIPRHNEDFGQTLASWGVPAGPYFVLPLFGPRYLRHSAGMLPDRFMDPIVYIDDDALRYSLLGLDIVQARAGFIGTDDLLELQLDPYTFVRETYFQQRRAALADQAVSQGNEFDDGIEDEFDDDI